MKGYKEFEKVSIGISDISALVAAHPQRAEYICFGEDGEYSAYVCEGEVEIGSHYKKVLSATSWLKIYDDFGLVYKAFGECIDVYRAGNFGCIIHIHKREEEKRC